MTTSQTDHSMLHILNCLTLVSVHDDGRKGTKAQGFVRKETRRRLRPALKMILDGSEGQTEKSDRFYMSHGWLRLGKKRPSGGAESTTVRSDRGRSDDGEPWCRARAGEMKKKKKKGQESRVRAVLEWICPDFPLAGPRSVLALATSPKFLDKRTEMGILEG